MFQANEHYKVWIDLQGAHRKHDIVLFEEILDEAISSLRTHRDDLRMAFFIGLRFEKEYYLVALKHFSHWRKVNSEDINCRIELFFHAVRYSIPSHKRKLKKMMIDELCRVVGIDKKEAPNNLSVLPMESRYTHSMQVMGQPVIS